jgi:hypothetical protein
MVVKPIEKAFGRAAFLFDISSRLHLGTKHFVEKIRSAEFTIQYLTSLLLYVFFRRSHIDVPIRASLGRVRPTASDYPNQPPSSESFPAAPT